MQITIVCSKCGKELDLIESIIDVMGNIVTKVNSCDDVNCYSMNSMKGCDFNDCNKCDIEEELLSLKDSVNKLKSTIKTEQDK